MTSEARFCERLRQVTEEEKSDLDDAIVIRANPFGSFVRFVTHCNVSYEDTLLAIKKLKYVIQEFEKRHSGGLVIEEAQTNGNGNGYQ